MSSQEEKQGSIAINSLCNSPNLPPKSDDDSTPRSRVTPLALCYTPAEGAFFTTPQNTGDNSDTEGLDSHEFRLSTHTNVSSEPSVNSIPSFRVLGEGEEQNEESEEPGGGGEGGGSAIARRCRTSTSVFSGGGQEEDHNNAKEEVTVMVTAATLTDPSPMGMECETNYSMEIVDTQSRSHSGMLVEEGGGGGTTTVAFSSEGKIDGIEKMLRQGGTGEKEKEKEKTHPLSTQEDGGKVEKEEKEKSLATVEKKQEGGLPHHPINPILQKPVLATTWGAPPIALPPSTSTKEKEGSPAMPQARILSLIEQGAAGDVYVIDIDPPTANKETPSAPDNYTTPPENLRAMKEMRNTNYRSVEKETEHYRRDYRHPNLVRYLLCDRSFIDPQRNTRLEMDFMNLGSLKRVIDLFPPLVPPPPSTTGIDTNPKKLDRLVTKLGGKYQPLDDKERLTLSWAIGYQLFMGLEYCHSGHGMMHRDIKPGNLLLNAEGRLKLCDFDAAVADSLVHLTECGTPDYSAPEVKRYRKQTTAMDIWSAGTLLFELATGKHPYGHMFLRQRMNCLDSGGCFSEKKKNNGVNSEDVDGGKKGANVTIHNEKLEQKEEDEEQLDMGDKISTEIKTFTMNTPSPSSDSDTWMRESYAEKVDFRFVKHDGLRDLLQRCLRDEPTERITAGEALLHPFFSKAEKFRQSQMTKRLSHLKKKKQQQQQINEKSSDENDNLVQSNSNVQQPSSSIECILHHGIDPCAMPTELIQKWTAREKELRQSEGKSKEQMESDKDAANHFCSCMKGIIVSSWEQPAIQLLKEWFSKRKVELLYPKKACCGQHEVHHHHREPPTAVELEKQMLARKVH